MMMKRQNMAEARRDSKGHWLDGVSGNPGGRPAVARDFAEECRSFMTEEGRKRLFELAQDPESPHHFRALELIAAYGLGRPMARMEGSLQVADTSEKDPAQLRAQAERVEALLSALDARRKELIGGQPEGGSGNPNEGDNAGEGKAV